MIRNADEHLRVSPKFKADIKEVQKYVEAYQEENQIKINSISTREITRVITKHKHWKMIIRELKEYLTEGEHEE